MFALCVAMYRCCNSGYRRTLSGSRYAYRKCGISTSVPSKNSHNEPLNQSDEREGHSPNVKQDLLDALSYSSKILEGMGHRDESRKRFKREKQDSIKMKIPPVIDIAVGKSRKKVTNTTFTISSKRAKHVTINSDGSIQNDNRAKLTPHVIPPPLVSGLDRVLYQPVTLHPLRDSRTGVYNFNPELEKITPDYLEAKDGASHFITPYKDQKLSELAHKSQRKYVSSTSSMTSVLSHMHYLLSNFRPVNIIDSPISRHFPQKNCNFTQGAQFPAAIILRKLDKKVKSIDSDRSLDREIILSILGHSLEEFLTETSPEQGEAYHYSKIDEFILRSQLDAYDSKLPGTGVFDLKTRAVAAIRHDLSYVEKNNNHTGYEIDKVYGEFESLEREFFELIRSTLLKYSLQARIGKMDGIFVAYHNISRMFGFQYLPLEEIDYIIHSSYDAPFKRAMDERNNTLRNIYGDENFILKHQRNEREIASKVADAEFKMSIILLKNALTYIEDKLNSMGIKDWKMCKIMMKTEQITETIPNSEKRATYPSLKVVVLPLPLEYVDKPLVTRGKKQKEILSQISNIQDYNEKLLTLQTDSMFGFEIRADHFYKNNPSGVYIPPFARVENKVLDIQSCQQVSKRLFKDYYQNLKKDKSPSFFHPMDVETWKTTCTFIDIEDKGSLQKIYRQLLNEKFQSLRDQSITKESLNSSDEDIVERIKSFLDIKEKRSSPKGTSNAPSHFQTKLRAYAKKGSLRRKLLDEAEDLKGSNSPF